MFPRVLKSLVAAAIVALALSGCSVSFGNSAETIRNLGIHYTVETDGTIHVTETIEYDFAGSDGKHGIDRYLVARQSTESAGKDRVYRYVVNSVKSPTGASALYSTTLDNKLQIRVGNKNATVSGVQKYIIKYDIHGALNRALQQDGSFRDELYWNATGNYWDPSILHTTITVDGPAAVESVNCYSGFEGSQDACTKSGSSGTTATFTQAELTSYQGVTIDVAWPDNTFSNTAMIIEPSLPVGFESITAGSNDGPDPYWSPLNLGIGAGLIAGVPLLFQLIIVARRRDKEFVGVTPGQIPSNPGTAEVGPAPRDETVVVQYQPPKGLPVGAAGTVLNKKRKNSDITATLIDLAVRGYLRIEEVEGGNKHKAKDYTLVATPERAAQKKAASRPGGPDATELLPHEALLLSKLFDGFRTSVTLSSLTNTFASDMRAITKALDTWIQNQQYFIDKINSTHPLISWGIILGIGGFFVSNMLGATWGLIPVGLGIGSFLTLGRASKAARRSALGHAVYVNLAGFKEYIATAEADQIRFEEGDDVFSRYMPWAMVFGEAERWSKVFAELVAQGKVQPTPDWYVGSAGFRAGYLSGTVASISSIGSAVDSFTSMATSSFTSTPGSSGGSGSGGGGSSGGGGGGGGGGSW